MCNTHAASNRNIEPFQFAVVAHNSNETEIIGKHVDIVCGRYRNSNFELGSIWPLDDGRSSKEGAYLPRKVEFAIQGFEVLECVTSYEFFVEPNLVVGSCLRNKMAADFLCEVEDLLMQLRHGGNRRANNIPEKNVSCDERKVNTL